MIYKCNFKCFKFSHGKNGRGHLRELPGTKIVSGPNFDKKDIKKRLKLVWYLFKHLQMFVHN